MNSLYYPYRERLALLDSDHWQDEALGHATLSWTAWDDAVPWQRHFGRFDPPLDGPFDGHSDRPRGPYATVLLQQSNQSTHLCLVEVFEQRPTTRGNDDLGYPHSVLGWIRLRRFPDDDRLPTLTDALASHPRVDVLRYRPNKRCTFRVTPGNGHPALFGKVFADHRGARIHRDGLALWEVSERGMLGFAVARPGRWCSRTLTLWQSAVAGRPLVDELCSEQGVPLAERLGAAAASITCSDLQPELRFDASAQMQRTQKYALELMKRLPDLEQRLAGLLQALQQAHGRSEQRQLKPLHGAPHAHQWLDAGERLGLVDFDRVCLGQPELDAATFIAELDFEDRDSVPVDALNAAFLDSYQRVAGPLDKTLLQAYRAHKRLAKALKAARALRVNGDQKARRHVEYASVSLQGNPS